MSGFTAPSNAGSSNKLDVEKIPSGLQYCTLYGMADLGTQDGGNYGDKRQLQLAFEFPQHMRIFYEGDQPKPSAIFTRVTFSMHEKATLRKQFVEPMIGRKLSEQEAETFDLQSLIGKTCVANITHTSDGKYANISSIFQMTEQHMNLFGLQSMVVPQINQTFSFHTSHGYESDNFKTLPKFVRGLIKESDEGKAHSLKGGSFSEPDENGSNNGNSSAPNVSKVKEIEMLPSCTFTKEALVNEGWTYEQMVQSGYAKWKEAVAPPTPTTTTTAPPPQVPPASAPQAPAPAPVSSVPKLVMNDPTQKVEDWIAQGWTEKQLVELGHAKMV